MPQATDGLIMLIVHYSLVKFFVKTNGFGRNMLC